MTLDKETAIRLLASLGVTYLRFSLSGGGDSGDCEIDEIQFAERHPDGQPVQPLNLSQVPWPNHTGGLASALEDFAADLPEYDWVNNSGGSGTVEFHPFNEDPIIVDMRYGDYDDDHDDEEDDDNLDEPYPADTSVTRSPNRLAALRALHAAISHAPSGTAVKAAFDNALSFPIQSDDPLLKQAIAQFQAGPGSLDAAKDCVRLLVPPGLIPAIDDLAWTHLDSTSGRAAVTTLRLAIAAALPGLSTHNSATEA